jgi:hypothetical protein
MDIRLRWVLADPTRERAADPLGMGAHADQIADRLLPNLSVQTSRARYLSFLCWSVQKSRGRSSTPITAIHRLEAKLALQEAKNHRHDPKECSWIGSRVARQYLEEHNWKEPARPERLYKNTAFVTYRPIMRAVGLLTSRRTPELTSTGERLANAFNEGRRPWCLGNISSKERAIIKGLLGLDDRRQSSRSPAAERRRRTFQGIRRLLQRVNSSADILEKHAELGQRPSETDKLLHSAFAWEVLSCGLELTFSMLLGEERITPIVRALRVALKRAPHRQPLRKLDPGDPKSSGQVVALLRTAVRLHREPVERDPIHPVTLARMLVLQSKTDEFLRQLINRHQRVKSENPWIELTGDKIKIVAGNQAVAFAVEPRTYRLDAFAQVLRDLGIV